MSQSSDMDVLKDIPGYKAILKSVLKSQIQLLIEQLADHTGEESIILTASINDGTLSHLGSSTGKGFLEGRDDMKSQFLGYCLKTHHKKKTTVETKSPSYQRSNQRHMPYKTPPKRDRIHPVSLQRAQLTDGSGSGLIDPSEPQLDTSQVGSDYVKLERNDTNPSTSMFPSSLQLSHTQTSGDLEETGHGISEGQTGQSGVEESNGASESPATDIKIEPITENEMELEITGVEPGNVSLGQDDWGQGQAAGYATPSDGDTSLNQSADASNYMSLDSKDGLHINPVEDPPVDSSGQLPTETNIQSAMLENINKITSQKERKYGCRFCTLRCVRKSELIRHERLHTGERPYRCHICGNGFVRKYDRDRHMLRHQKYGCELRPKAVNDLSDTI